MLGKRGFSLEIESKYLNFMVWRYFLKFLNFILEKCFPVKLPLTPFVGIYLPPVIRSLLLLKRILELGWVVLVTDRMYVTAVMSSKGHASPSGFCESIGLG